MKLKEMKMCERAKGQWDGGRGEGIKRVNKGDGREWKGIKICAGERGINVERVVEIRGGKGGFIRGMEENGKG